MTARDMEHLERLTARAQACNGWHKVWAESAGGARCAGSPLRHFPRNPFFDPAEARRHAARARVALASARKAWARVAEYARECGL